MAWMGPDGNACNLAVEEIGSSGSGTKDLPMVQVCRPTRTPSALDLGQTLRVEILLIQGSLAGIHRPRKAGE